MSSAVAFQDHGILKDKPMTVSKDILDNTGQSGGQTIEMTDARGAQRVGLIWVLGISMILAVVALFGYWALDSHHLSQGNSSGASVKAASDTFHAGPAPVTPHA